MSQNEKSKTPERKPKKGPEEEFERWRFYYLYHGKAVSEYSPELNILIRQYAIKRIYEISKENPEIMKKSDEFLVLVCKKEKAEEIAKNFNPDNLLSYEDFTNSIEKIFESAETSFKERIMQNNYCNFTDIIAAYKLLTDLIDLVDLWKEKDENITKVQNFCKYRAVQVYKKYVDYKTLPKSELEKEVEKLSEEVQKEKIEEEKKQKEMENAVKDSSSSLKRNQTVPTNKNVILQNPVTGGYPDINCNYNDDFSQFKKMTTLVSSGGTDKSLFSSYIPKITTYSIILDNNQSSNSNQDSVPNPVPNTESTMEQIKNMNFNFSFSGPSHSAIESNQRSQNSELANPFHPEEDEIENPYLNITLNFKEQPQKFNQVSVKKKDPDEDELDLILKNLGSKDVSSNEFVQQKTSLLNKYTLPKNDQCGVQFPVAFQSKDYKQLIKYSKDELIKQIIQNVKEDKLNDALSNSEKLLYYLTNITPGK